MTASLESLPWHPRAKCRYMPPRLFDGGNTRRRDQVLARSIGLCWGCPVMKECALDALEHSDEAVIRAGIPLPGKNHYTNPIPDEYQAALSELAAGASPIDVALTYVMPGKDSQDFRERLYEEIGRWVHYLKPRGHRKAVAAGAR